MPHADGFNPGSVLVPNNRPSGLGWQDPAEAHLPSSCWVHSTCAYWQFARYLRLGPGSLLPQPVLSLADLNMLWFTDHGRWEDSWFYNGLQPYCLLSRMKSKCGHKENRLMHTNSKHIHLLGTQSRIRTYNECILNPWWMTILKINSKNSLNAKRNKTQFSTVCM